MPGLPFFSSLLHLKLDCQNPWAVHYLYTNTSSLICRAADIVPSSPQTAGLCKEICRSGGAEQPGCNPSWRAPAEAQNITVMQVKISSFGSRGGKSVFLFFLFFFYRCLTLSSCSLSMVSLASIRWLLRTMISLLSARFSSSWCWDWWRESSKTTINLKKKKRIWDASAARLVHVWVH